MIDWQQYAALSITGLAGLYLLVRLERFAAHPTKTSCASSCGGCRGEPARKPLVTLQGSDQRRATSDQG